MESKINLDIERLLIGILDLNEESLLELARNKPKLINDAIQFLNLKINLLVLSMARVISEYAEERNNNENKFKS